MDADALRRLREAPSEKSLLTWDEFVNPVRLDDLRALLAERDALRAVLRECRDDLRKFVEDKHDLRVSDDHPGYVKDTAPVRRADELLERE